MKKAKRYENGGDVKDFENPYVKPGPGKKPLPSEIKTEGKAPFDKYVREPVKKFSDKVSDFADKRGLANPMEVVNEALGGETREESKARRAGMPMTKPSVNKKAGGSVGYKSGGSVKARGCGIARKGLTKGRMV